jgi:protein-L-isoaspartate(D-aspartate) O-methyltransferase
LQEKAPFQAILVTAASGSIPLALVDQLDLGGRMVIPIGSQEGTQNLVVLVKNETGDVTKKEVLPVSFVPLV